MADSYIDGALPTRLTIPALIVARQRDAARIRRLKKWLKNAQSDEKRAGT